MNSLQCQPPEVYKDWINSNTFPICTTSEDIRHILDPTTDELQKYPKPCRGIEKLIFDYDEGFEKAHIDSEDCKTTDNSWLYVKVYFGETTYKEIRQVQDITVDVLFGNISGYIGFFLGYSLLQIPNLISFVCNILQGYLTSYKTPKQNRKSSSRLTPLLPK